MSTEDTTFLSHILKFLSAGDIKARQETLFAVGFSIRQIRGGINREMLLDLDLLREAFDRYVNVGRHISVEDVHDFASMSPVWVESVVMGCNTLSTSRFVMGRRYDIYRGVGIMQDIYLTKKRLNYKMTDDEWNPSNIWISKIKKIPPFDNISQLNHFIRENLMSGVLIGVSIKRSLNPRIVHIKQEDYKLSSDYLKIM